MFRKYMMPMWNMWSCGILKKILTCRQIPSYESWCDLPACSQISLYFIYFRFISTVYSANRAREPWGLVEPLLCIHNPLKLCQEGQPLIPPLPLVTEIIEGCDLTQLGRHLCHVSAFWIHGYCWSRIAWHIIDHVLVALQVVIKSWTHNVIDLWCWLSWYRKWSINIEHWPNVEC